MDRTITRETLNSGALGRAAAFRNGAEKFAHPKHLEERVDKFPLMDFDADTSNERTTYINDLNKPEHKHESEPPIVSLISLDLAFARIGSWMMMLKGLLSFFISDEVANDPTKMNFVKGLDDILFKVRQQCQYSIHAQPGLSLRKPDDIASDMVHNMQAAALGKKVYVYNAFVAPWLSLIKIFFPYNNNPIFGLIPRMVDFADSTINKLTNIFWNVRRISKSLVPYDGGISSEALTEKQSQVRDLMGFYWKSLVLRPYNSVVKFIFKGNTGFEISSDLSSNFDGHKIANIQTQSIKDYWNNIKALFSRNYRCVHEGGVPKQVGSEEPENLPWYVRSRMFSHIFGLWAGLFGGAFNSVSIGLNLIGSLFDITPLRKISDTLTDQANALMSLVYLTGEVPANINEYFKKKKYGGENGIWNLAVAGIGALGTLNRIKLNPILGTALNVVRIKPFLDKWDRLLKNCFLLFFSANRWVMHNDERNAAIHSSSRHDIQVAERHANFWKHFSLPFRVLIRDPDVSYTDQEILKTKTLAA